MKLTIQVQIKISALQLQGPFLSVKIHKHYDAQPETPGPIQTRTRSKNMDFSFIKR